MNYTLPSRRSVLICTYRFPPVASINAIRLVKLVKYLDRLGWRSTVLTPQWSDRIREDRELLDEIPIKTRVERVGSVAPYSRPDILKTLENARAIWRFVPMIERNVLLFPDNGRAWMRPLRAKLKEELNRSTHSVLLTSAPPFTVHLAALGLGRSFSVPWVAEFRDPWTDRHERSEKLWSVTKIVDCALEAKVLREADVVVGNTEVQTKIFQQRTVLDDDSVTWIPNGYDEDDFAHVSSDESCDRFTITYVGSFYYSYNPAWFLGVVSDLIRDGIGPKFTLRFIGTSAPWVDDFVEDRALRERLHLQDHVPHPRVPDILVRSNILLLVLAPGGQRTPAKLYEYLRAGRPIIAMGPSPGDVRQILEETGRGRYFGPDSADALKAHLRSLYESWQVHGTVAPWPPNEAIEQFELSAVAHKLRNTLERTVSNYAD